MTHKPKTIYCYCPKCSAICRKWIKKAVRKVDNVVK